MPYPLLNNAFTRQLAGLNRHTHVTGVGPSSPLLLHGAEQQVDGRELLRGQFAAFLEQLDEAGGKSPDERAWYALGVASGFEAIRFWPSRIGEGVRGLRQSLSVAEDGIASYDRIKGTAPDPLAFFRYRVACAQLTAMLAAVTGEIGSRLVVRAELDPKNDFVVSVGFNGGAAIACGAVWDFVGELSRYKTMTMRRLRNAAVTPPPPAEESIARADAAFADLEEFVEP